MIAISHRTRPLGAFLVCLVGPVIWAGHLFLLYGGATLICLGPPVVGSRIFLVFASAVTAGALAGLAFFAGGRFRRLRHSLTEDRFLNRISLYLTLLSVLGIFWASYAAVALRACRTPFSH